MIRAFNLIPSSTQEKTSRLGLKFFVAGLITGVNWYTQVRLGAAQRQKQNQIIKRVNDNKTIQKQQLKDIAKLSQMQGCRVKVTGETTSGRFVIRRKRQGQEGYQVLAPFIINKTNTNNQKYMLNLGWIPLDSKPKVAEFSAFNPIGYDELPEELVQDQDAPALSTVTAFVRRGQKRDVLRGYNNWVKDKVFKFIDLQYMEKVFSCTDIGFRYVYLDRAGVQGEESFPFPQTNETYIKQLNQQSDFNEKKRKIYSYGVGITSFAAAVLL